MRCTRRRLLQAAGAVGVALASNALIGPALAQNNKPIRIGFSIAQTGPLSAAGKSGLLALQIWRDDVNARGGLLGRPVELVVYDDQGNASLTPAIYTKLIDVDKVDLLIAPYGTNPTASVMPLFKQRGLLAMGNFALEANTQIRHDKYFSWAPEKTMEFPGMREFIARYQAKAKQANVDPLGFYLPPYDYAIGEMLAQAVSATQSLDHKKLAQDLHTHDLQTVVGTVRYGADGEWANSRMIYVQFRDIADRNLDQFRQSGKQVIVTPDAFKTGEAMPFNQARK